eukprot:symbB.v1.2.006227.t1/scaffold340.1/size245066/13
MENDKGLRGAIALNSIVPHSFVRSNAANHEPKTIVAKRKVLKRSKRTPAPAKPKGSEASPEPQSASAALPTAPVACPPQPRKKQKISGESSSKASQASTAPKPLLDPVPSRLDQDLVSARELVTELAVRGREACEVKVRSLTSRPEVLGPVLAHCAERGLEVCVQLLLQKRAAPESCGLRGLARSQVVLGKRTALQLAAENGHVSVCRLLLQGGCDRAPLSLALQTLRQYGRLYESEIQELQTLTAMPSTAACVPKSAPTAAPLQSGYLGNQAVLPPQGAVEHHHCCDEEEDLHYAEVCYSLLSYAEDAESELQSISENFSFTDVEDLPLMKFKLSDLLTEMTRCAEVNDQFLKMLVQSDLDAQEFWEMPSDHQVQERNSIKVRTVLRQFVRDWADEGAPERDLQYGCLLDALERYVPNAFKESGGQAKKSRVLTPGSGLSRLPFECARRGYAAQGNEFSYHMLQGCKWVLNETAAERTHTIYPFVLNLENRRAARDHAVLTCFFLDTAKNVFLYIRTIADIIRPGGLWANFGPLLYHYAEQPDQISIELSWEEVKPEIKKYFDFKEEDQRIEFGNWFVQEESIISTHRGPVPGLQKSRISKKLYTPPIPKACIEPATSASILRPSEMMLKLRASAPAAVDAFVSDGDPGETSPPPVRGTFLDLTLEEPATETREASTGAQASVPESATLIEAAGPVALQAADFGFAEDEDGSISSASSDEAPKGAGTAGYASGTASAPAAPTVTYSDRHEGMSMKERLDSLEFSDAEDDDDDPLGLTSKK